MKKYLIVTGLLAAGLLALMLAGCVGNETESAAQKAAVQQLTERISGLENRMKNLTADVDACMIELNNQRQAGGGVSPELVQKIDTMDKKLKSLETAMTDLDGMKSSISDLKKNRSTTVSQAAPASPSTATVEKAKGADADASKSVVQVTKKPSGVYHKIQKGETLTSIAKKYGVTIQAIQKENHLPANAIIQAGASLYIPR